MICKVCYKTVNTNWQGVKLAKLDSLVLQPELLQVRAFANPVILFSMSHYCTTLINALANNHCAFINAQV